MMTAHPQAADRMWVEAVSEAGEMYPRTGLQRAPTATSGVTYFRSIGGSFGTAVFGSIFSSRVSASIAHYPGPRSLPAGVSSAALSPRTLNRLPPAVHHAFIDAYASSLQGVFRAAAPVAAVGFPISWLLPEVKLRKTVTAVDPGQTFGMPTDRTSVQELERVAGVLAHREDRMALYRRISVQAGLDGLWPAACCLLSRVAKQSGSRLRSCPCRSALLPRPSARSSPS